MADAVRVNTEEMAQVAPTLRAGQPMLMSSDWKRSSAVTFAAASPITDGSLPKSWQAVLSSSG